MSIINNNHTNLDEAVEKRLQLPWYPSVVGYAQPLLILFDIHGQVVGKSLHKIPFIVMLIRFSQQLFYKESWQGFPQGRIFPHPPCLCPPFLFEPRVQLRFLQRQTALHFAAREGRDAAVQELIRRHADVARRTAHGILPLELAQPNCQALIREEACRRIKAGMVD